MHCIEILASVNFLNSLFLTLSDNFITFRTIFHDTYDRSACLSLCIFLSFFFGTFFAFRLFSRSLPTSLLLSLSSSLCVCLNVCSRLYTPNFRKFLQPNWFCFSFGSLVYLFNRLRFFSLDSSCNQIELNTYVNVLI